MEASGAAGVVGVGFRQPPLRESEHRRLWLGRAGGLRRGRFSSRKSGENAPTSPRQGSFLPGSSPGLDARRLEKKVFIADEHPDEQVGEQVPGREICA